MLVEANNADNQTAVVVAADGAIRGYEKAEDGGWGKSWEWQAACKDVECSVSMSECF